MSKQNKCGRPEFIPVIPKDNFTMRQLCEANGVDVTGTPKTNKNWGKGESCIRLTLMKWVKRNKNNRRSGLISLTTETRPADGGLGAPQKVYVARNSADCGVAAAKARREAFAATLAVSATTKTTKTRKPRKAKVVKVAKVAKAKRKYTRKAKVAAPATTGLSAGTQTYEDIKAILATPEPAPVATPEPVTGPVTVPVAEIPAPAPVTPAVETPAPVATPETVTAPVAS